MIWKRIKATSSHEIFMQSFKRLSNVRQNEKPLRRNSSPPPRFRTVSRQGRTPSTRLIHLAERARPPRRPTISQRRRHHDVQPSRREGKTTTSDHLAERARPRRLSVSPWRQDHHVSSVSPPWGRDHHDRSVSPRGRDHHVPSISPWGRDTSPRSVLPSWRDDFVSALSRHQGDFNPLSPSSRPHRSFVVISFEKHFFVSSRSEFPSKFYDKN